MIYLKEYQRSRDRIRKFIQNQLGKKLQADQKELKILSEADLQSCAYHHLSNFFAKKKFSRWYILNQLPMGKKHQTKKIPDLVIARMRESGDVKPIFLIELKETEKYKKSAVVHDIKKLKGLLKKYKKWCEGCFFIYSVYDDELDSEEILVKINIIRDKYLKRLQNKSKIFSIPVNVVHSLTHHNYDVWREKRLKLRKFRR